MLSNLKIVLTAYAASSIRAIMDLGDWEPVPLPQSEDGKSVSLDPDQLEAGQKLGNVLVMFHAPWCSHCATLMPEFEKASELVFSQNFNATFATFDGAVHNQYLQSNMKDKLKGFPTLRWYTRHGDSFDYSGPRKAAIIANWVKFMKADPITDMLQVPTPSSIAAGSSANSSSNMTKNELDSSKHLKAVVTLVAPSRTAAFERLALQYRTEAKFAFVEDSDYFADAKMIVHRPDEEAKEMYEIENRDAVKDFFLRERLPTFGEMSRESFAQYRAQGKVGLVYVLFNHKDDADLNAQVSEHKQTVGKLAKKWWGKYAFVYVNTLKNAEKLKQEFSVKDFPAVIVTSMKQESDNDAKRFVLQGEFDAARVNDFLVGIVDGSARPHFKSEDVPSNEEQEKSDNFNGLVKIVGKNLLSEVFRPDRDFFLEIYAPWCVHCHSLAQQVENLSQNLVNVGAGDLIQVGRLNGQANDSPSKLIRWDHFPTLMFVKAGASEPIIYAGDRTASDMLSFIAQHSDQKVLQKAICQILARTCQNATCGPKLCAEFPSSSKLTSNKNQSSAKPRYLYQESSTPKVEQMVSNSHVDAASAHAEL